MKAITLVLLNFLAFGIHAGVCSAEDFAALGRLLESEKSRLKIPGYAAAVYYHGEVIWSKAGGIADLKSRRKVKRDTPFRLASISKPLTAVGLLQLVEMKRLSLNDEIRKHCPAFGLKHPAIQLGQLLGHLGGIRSYNSKDPEDANNNIHFSSIVDALQKFAADPLAHAPGTKYLYSTYGYSLVGCAMEGAAGIPFEKWMEDKVFATVGMYSTAPDNGRGIALQRAQGYRRNADGEVEDCAISDNTAKIPGGGYVSTTDDLMRFAEGIYRQQLLKSETTDLMWTSGKLKTGKLTGYGLGWSLAQSPEGDREIYHTGGQQGTSTILYLRPEQHFAFVWLTNMEGVDKRLPTARQAFKIVSAKTAGVR